MKNRTIFFQAYGIAPDENPSYAKICKANIDEKSKVTILTPEEATHEVIFLRVNVTSSTLIHARICHVGFQLEIFEEN